MNPKLESPPDHRSRRRPGGRGLLLMAAGSLAFALTATTGRADLQLTIGNFQTTAGGGTFEVDVTNTNPAGGVTYDVAGYSLQLETSDPFRFTDATTGTTAYTYIFAGVNDPGSFVVTPTPPTSTTSIITVDSAFTVSSVPLAPGQTAGVALITYTGSGTIPVSVVDLGEATLFTDESGNGIPFAAVPEPSSSTIVLLAGTMLLSARGVRRRIARWRGRQA